MHTRGWGDPTPTNISTDPVLNQRDKDNKEMSTHQEVISNESTALSMPGDNYVSLQMAREELREVIQGNLDGESLSVADLVNVRVPAGGATQWQIEDVEGDRSVAELRGVIVYTHQQRAYWSKPFGSSDDVSPDCWSPDAEVGEGTPGGDCSQCPLAQYGTAATGKGQACKLTRRLFLLPEDSLLPMAVTLPPASLKNVRKYLTGLSSKGRGYVTVETILSLVADKNDQGIKYSKVELRLAGVLPDARAQQMREYADMMRPLLARTAVIDSVAKETARVSGQA